MARPKRNPATPNEIFAAFSDFPTSTQEIILEQLANVHRILKRERSRSAPPSDPLLEQLVVVNHRAVPANWLIPDPEKERRLTGEGNA